MTRDPFSYQGIICLFTVALTRFLLEQWTLPFLVKVWKSVTPSYLYWASRISSSKIEDIYTLLKRGFSHTSQPVLTYKDKQDSTWTFGKWAYQLRILKSHLEIRNLTNIGYVSDSSPQGWYCLNHPIHMQLWLPYDWVCTSTTQHWTCAESYLLLKGVFNPYQFVGTGYLSF